MNANDIIQLMGVLYFTFGLGFILNKKYYKDVFSDMVKSKLFMFFGWYIALVLGFVIVLFFDTVSVSKEGFVSLLGWMALVKWIIIILFPKFFLGMTKSFTKKKNFILQYELIRIYL